MTLSVLLGATALFGVPAAALADTGPGGGQSGDGNLHLIPEVIANAGISAGGSDDFPFRSRLFLPEVTGRAQGLAAERAKATDVVGSLTFTSVGAPAAHDLYAETRGRLFDGYSPRAVASSESQTAAGGADIWFVAMAAAGIPLAALAVLVGSKDARRKVRRHA